MANSKVQSGKSAVLLMNLGSPDSPEVPDVRRYLRVFLMDPLVIDIPWISRWLLVHLAILPRRPAASSEAYKKVWTKEGSPLIVFSRALEKKVSERLIGRLTVKLAMRYGKPSIESAVRELRDEGCDRVLLLPLYPQYSTAATLSSLKEARRLFAEIHPAAALSEVSDFFDAPEFIDNLAEIGTKWMKAERLDHLLFSFHGLPERQMPRNSEYCRADASCCLKMNVGNRTCYRAQSYSTARATAGKMGLPESRYDVSFQSRLGRAEWIKPYTDFVLPELPKRGIRRLGVMCPAFVADCLETLEEIGIRAREQFIAAGGEELVLIPCLNAEDSWCDGLVRIVERELNRELDREPRL